MAKRIACIFALICGFYAILPAQVTLSPYSRYGVGDLFDASSTRNFSMGGLGIANYNRSTVNRINPASYGDIRLTTLDFSAVGGYLTQKSSGLSRSTGTGGFHNLSLAFSTRKNWGLVIGLAPYSSAGYQVVTTDQVLVDTVLENSTVTYSADGGLNQFYAGFGAKFFRRLNVGMNLSYAFGNTTFNWTNDFDNSNYQSVNIEKRVSLKGIIPQFGVQFGDTVKFTTTIDKLKGLEQDYKDLEGNLATLAKEKENLKKEESKLAEESVGIEAKKAEIKAEKDQIAGQVGQLMDNEDENRKEINRLQEKAFRLEKKRKKLDREYRVEVRKVQADLARVDGQMGKVRTSQEVNLEKQQAIRNGDVAQEGRKTSKFLYRIGGILETPAKLNGERLVRYDNQAIFDTLGTLTTGSVSLPLKYGGGISVGKPLRWMVGADITLQDWSKFQYFNEANTLKSAMKINFGGEITPKLISSKYGNRISYRLGGYYQNTHLNFGGTDITEYGITAGVGLPMGFFNPVGLSYSRMNIGISYGRRGTLANNLLEESVITMRIGVNLNDVWFRKRVVD